jgi:hypothetical protein
MTNVIRIGLLFALGISVVAYSQTINGKPVKQYAGPIANVNVAEGKAQVNFGAGTGNWRFGPETRILFGGDRVSRATLEHAKKVIVFVSEDGFMQEINIEEMKDAWPSWPDVGEVVSFNARTGEIVIKMANSRGTWHVDESTRVMWDGKVVPTQDVLRTRQVRARVAQTGRVETIEILRMRNP